MPRVMRRTPAASKAMEYGYRSFLQDIVAQAGRNVERMTSGGLSKEELLEMATAGGGMLKMAGTGKLLAGLLRRQKAFEEGLHFQGHKDVGGDPAVAAMEQYSRVRGIFKEALKVPEKEYRRIKDIDWKVGNLRWKGEYDPHFKSIGLSPRLADPETIWHEFTHARQWAPEKEEKIAASALRLLNQELSRRSNLSGQSDFYYNISPIEKHARNVAMTMTTGSKPSEFSGVYKGLLESVLAEGEKRVGSKRVRELWDMVINPRKGW